MKTYDVFGTTGESGEYVLGARETGSHACYLIYGVLKPGEKGRELVARRFAPEQIVGRYADAYLELGLDWVSL